MNSRITAIGLIFLMLFAYSSKSQISSDIESTALDLVKLKSTLQELDDQFANSFTNADSVAIAEHYAKDGTWGAIRGKENLISEWGKWILYAKRKGMPNMAFKISSVSQDGEFVVEIGSFEFSDLSNVVQSTGKYLVVRKLEDGQWKMYRDIGL